MEAGDKGGEEQERLGRVFGKKFHIIYCSQALKQDQEISDTAVTMSQNQGATKIVDFSALTGKEDAPTRPDFKELSQIFDKTRLAPQSIVAKPSLDPDEANDPISSTKLFQLDLDTDGDAAGEPEVTAPTQEMGSFQIELENSQEQEAVIEEQAEEAVPLSLNIAPFEEDSDENAEEEVEPLPQVEELDHASVVDSMEENLEESFHQTVSKQLSGLSFGIEEEVPGHAPIQQSYQLTDLHHKELSQINDHIKNGQAEKDDLRSKIIELEGQKIAALKQVKDLALEKDQIKIEYTLLKARYDREHHHFEMGLKDAREHQRLLVSQLEELQQQMEKFVGSKLIDEQKIRATERDLASKLELLRIDSAQQISVREQKLLEYKRKIDALEFYQQEAKASVDRMKIEKSKLEEKIQRMSRMLQDVLNLGQMGHYFETSYGKSHLKKAE